MLCFYLLRSFFIFHSKLVLITFMDTIFSSGYVFHWIRRMITSPYTLKCVIINGQRLQLTWNMNWNDNNNYLTLTAIELCRNFQHIYVFIAATYACVNNSWCNIDDITFTIFEKTTTLWMHNTIDDQTENSNKIIRISSAEHRRTIFNNKTTISFRFDVKAMAHIL